ncbi:MAG: putative nuclease YbcO [Luteibacter sp.]|uniref:nuclease domain-containing protein n=1 Tax=Luteibacter sp. TaxID=1886636 RepID=UPI00137C7C6F|nr:nuclease domain-containing protein [Luteibacter sp.]KAF1009510.1 MAG: putative nuclease YbcO [Luteibacter sp.]
MKTSKCIQRRAPIRQRKALGRVPKMARSDGAEKAVDAMAFPKRKAVKRSRPKMTPLRKSANGEGCTFNVAGVCNYDPKTVVLVHMRWLGDCGGSLKPTDLQAAYGCSECNRWTDSPSKAETVDRKAYEDLRNFYALRALVRTQQRMVAKGIITVKGIAA